MSRGFVKESDQEELPIVPPRADLPAGVMNYVTENGYDELIAERNQMLEERENLSTADENERRIAANYLTAKLQLLNDRIASAKIIKVAEQPQHEVRFGAVVSLKIDNDSKVQTYQIVGVDEANIAQRKIAFISPIAKILINKKVGEVAFLQLGKNQKKFEIVAIAY
ncbi:MAG TPA: GreA/GreB family elongation factor [Flavobacterium sp.]|jgi:transcription elongation factor GreB